MIWLAFSFVVNLATVKIYFADIKFDRFRAKLPNPPTFISVKLYALRNDKTREAMTIKLQNCVRVLCSLEHTLSGKEFELN